MELTQKQQEIANYLTSIGVDKKYKGKGCYAIYINGKLAYIGRSGNLFNRLVMHLYYIDYPFRANDKHKYELLKEAHSKGYDIDFDVVYRCKDNSHKEKEKKLIKRFLPPLNYLTYTGHCNAEAKTMSLNDLITKLGITKSNKYCGSQEREA